MPVRFTLLVFAVCAALAATLVLLSGLGHLEVRGIIDARGWRVSRGRDWLQVGASVFLYFHSLLFLTVWAAATWEARRLLRSPSTVDPG